MHEVGQEVREAFGGHPRLLASRHAPVVGQIEHRVGPIADVRAIVFLHPAFVGLVRENAIEKEPRAHRAGGVSGDATDDLQRRRGDREMIRQQAMRLVVLAQPGGGARKGGNEPGLELDVEPVTPSQECVTEIEAREGGRGKALLVRVRLVVCAAGMLQRDPVLESPRDPLLRCRRVIERVTRVLYFVQPHQRVDAFLESRIGKIGELPRPMRP